MLRAISFGVLRRSAPSTRAIILSRKLWPGSWVISTTIRSERTRVPPVTALRSPPDSRTTGADSPVIADSSTEAMPSITVPSPGIVSPASTTTTSPRRSSEAGFSPPSRSWATVSVRIERSASAWALPRPSASASAKLAKTTVSQSQTPIEKANQAGSSPPPSGAPPKTWISQPTGGDHGADLDHEHHRVAELVARVELAQRVERGPQHDRAVEQRARLVAEGLVGHRAASLSRARLSSSDVDAGLAEEAEEAAVGVLVDQVEDAVERQAAHRGDAMRLDAGVGLGDVGVDPGGRGGDRVDRHVGGGQAGVVAAARAPGRRRVLPRRIRRVPCCSARGC